MALKGLSPVQMDTTLLDVTCCVHLLMLLYVVACCWEETGQTFEPLTPNISINLILLLHILCIHMVDKVLWVVSFLWCTAGHNIVWLLS